MPTLSSSIERLESRIAPAVVFTLGDYDGDGVAHDLRITGGAGKERVLIEDSSSGALRTKISIDANGDGDFTDPADTNGALQAFIIQQFEINMGGGNDIVTVQLTGDYTTPKAFFTNLGPGNNEFHFLTVKGASDYSISAATRIDLTGGPQNDYMDLQFDDVRAQLDISVRLGAGRDGFLSGTKVTGPSSIIVGNGLFAGHLDADIDLGPGSNSFQLAFLDPSIGAFGAPGAMNYRILGSNVAADRDDITVSSVDSNFDFGSDVHITAIMGAGNDAFHAQLSGALTFVNSGGNAAAGRLVFDVDGGAGNDLIEALRFNPGTFQMDGVLQFNFRGGAGNDTIKVDLGSNTAAAQLTTVTAAIAQRALVLYLDGGAGNDTLSATVSNTAQASFVYDITLLGRAGNDQLNFSGSNNGGTVTYGGGGALIDGGLGTDTRNVALSGGFLAKQYN